MVVTTPQTVIQQLSELRRVDESLSLPLRSKFASTSITVETNRRDFSVVRVIFPGFEISSTVSWVFVFAERQNIAKRESVKNLRFLGEPDSIGTTLYVGWV